MPESKLTLQEFGARVKSKYPAYANMDDIELGRRVLAKYPVYADNVDESLQSQNQRNWIAEPVQPANPQPTMSAAPPRNIIQRGMDYIKEMGASRPIAPGGEPFGVTDFPKTLWKMANTAPLGEIARQYVNPAIDSAIGEKHPHASELLQGGAEAIGDMVTPFNVALISALGGVHNSAIPAVKDSAPLIGAGFSAMMGANAASTLQDAYGKYQDGDTRGAVRQLPHAGLSALFSAHGLAGMKGKKPNTPPTETTLQRQSEPPKALNPQPDISNKPVSAAPRSEPVTPNAEALIPYLAPDLNTPAVQPQPKPIPVSKSEPKPVQDAVNQKRLNPADVAEEMRGLADIATSKSNTNKTVRIAPVDEITRAEAKTNLGIDLSGYEHSADVFAVRHAINEHSGIKITESNRGQIAITPQDIVTVPEVVTIPDIRAYGLKNKRNQDLVVSIKRVPDDSLLVVEEVRTGRKTLALTSIRKYPAARGADSITRALVSYARSDGGNIKIIHRDSNASQQKSTVSERRTKEEIDANRQELKNSIESSLEKVEPYTRPIVEEIVDGRMKEIEELYDSLRDEGILSGKGKNIENIENANYGAYERSDRGFGKIRYKDQIAPELADINKSPSEIANAIRRDKDNELYLEVKDRVTRDVPERYADEIETMAERAAIREENSGEIDISNAIQGEHGPILKQYTGKPEKALTALRRLKRGEVPGAYYHKDVGDIDLIWGKAGNPAKDYAGGYGLAHIDAKHPGVADKLQRILDSTEIDWKNTNKSRIQLEDSDHIVKISLNYDFKKKTWLLTAYEKYK